MVKPIPRPRLLAAWGVALAADAIQAVLFPFFIVGALEGPDAVVDMLAGGLLTWLCGWHWVFLPTFAVELIPGVDLAPTWLAAMGWVTGRQLMKKPGEMAPLAPAPPPVKVTDVETK